MRRLITTAALALGLGGCVFPQVVAAPDYHTPLDAYILSPGHDLRFHVSRPAYVAVFEVLPGSRTRLLYPSHRQSRVYGEVHAGNRELRNGGEWERAGRRVGRSAETPRYLFLIASDHPLRLEHLDGAGYGTVTTVGSQSWSGHRPFDTMERLADLTVPPGVDDRSWTTDFYVYWPRALDGPRAREEVVVRCNGYEVVVPFEHAAQVRRDLCAQPSADRVAEAGSPGSGDSGRARRTRPVPPGANDGRAFAPRSRQLQQPGSRGPEARPGGREDAGEDEGSGDAATPAAPAAPGRRGGRATPATPAKPNGPGAPATPATPANPKGGSTPAAPSTEPGPEAAAPRGGPPTAPTAAPAPASEPDSVRARRRSQPEPAQPVPAKRNGKG